MPFSIESEVAQVREGVVLILLLLVAASEAAEATLTLSHTTAVLRAIVVTAAKVIQIDETAGEHVGSAGLGLSRSSGRLERAEA